MISLHRAAARLHEQHRNHEAWLAFDTRREDDPLSGGFGRLEHFNEELLPPGAHIARYPHHDAEVITYAMEGTLTFEDAAGRVSVINAGEFQRVSVVRGLRHSVANPSRADTARVFQLWLRPTDPLLESGAEQKRFSVAQRRGGLCLVASPDIGCGALWLSQDTRLYSALLEPGQHVVHALAAERSAWLHVMSGSITLDELVLNSGDAAAIISERAVSFTATEASELVLLDFGGALQFHPMTEDSNAIPTS